MADFYLRQNDTRPALRATLQDSSGAAVDLTGATVEFHMTGSGVTIDAAAVVQDASAGIVRYDWQAGDTATVGTFRFEFQVTYADGGIETWPNRGTWEVKISEEIG